MPPFNPTPVSVPNEEVREVLERENKEKRLDDVKMIMALPISMCSLDEVPEMFQKYYFETFESRMVPGVVSGMGLPYNIDSLDEIPEEHRKYYRENKKQSRLRKTEKLYKYSPINDTKFIKIPYYKHGSTVYFEDLKSKILPLLPKGLASRYSRLLDIKEAFLFQQHAYENAEEYTEYRLSGIFEGKEVREPSNDDYEEDYQVEKTLNLLNSYIFETDASTLMTLDKIESSKSKYAGDEQINELLEMFFPSSEYLEGEWKHNREFMDALVYFSTGRNDVGNYDYLLEDLLSSFSGQLEMNKNSHTIQSGLEKLFVESIITKKRLVQLEKNTRRIEYQNQVGEIKREEEKLKAAKGETGLSYGDFDYFRHKSNSIKTGRGLSLELIAGSKFLSGDTTKLSSPLLSSEEAQGRNSAILTAGVEPNLYGNIQQHLSYQARMTIKEFNDDFSNYPMVETDGQVEEIFDDGAKSLKVTNFSYIIEREAKKIEYDREKRSNELCGAYELVVKELLLNSSDSRLKDGDYLKQKLFSRAVPSNNL